MPAASVGVAAPKRIEPNTRPIRDKGGTALMKSCRSGTFGRFAGGASVGFTIAMVSMSKQYKPTKTKPGRIAPANRSPTEIDFGLKIPRLN